MIDGRTWILEQLEFNPIAQIQERKARDTSDCILYHVTGDQLGKYYICMLAVNLEADSILSCVTLQGLIWFDFGKTLLQQ